MAKLMVRLWMGGRWMGWWSDVKYQQCGLRWWCYLASTCRLSSFLVFLRIDGWMDG